MGEDEGGFVDGADLAWAGGDVPGCPPAAGQESEGPFAQGTQPAEQSVIGADADINHLAVGGLFERCLHAESGMSQATHTILEVCG